MVADWSGVLKRATLYLSGAVIEAYKAPNNLTTAYPIAELVKVSYTRLNCTKGDDDGPSNGVIVVLSKFEKIFEKIFFRLIFDGHSAELDALVFAIGQTANNPKQCNSL